MKTSIEAFFRDDPWELITSPCYPDARRLYLNDERFWVSMDQNHQILFFLQDAGGDRIKPIKNLAGMEISLEKVSSGESRLVCRLTSHDSELRDKFATVAKDIAFHCSEFDKTQLFVQAQNRLVSWANFLKPSREGLSQSEYVGLLGELYTLSQQVMKSLSAHDSIRAWVGPAGKKQDFSFESMAVEVKATMGGDRQVIPISSLDQLDRVTEKLYLLRLIFAPCLTEEGVTLSSLYEACLNQANLDYHARWLFLNKVSELFGKASDSQLSDKVAIAGSRLYEVRGDFPVLTRSNAPLAIRNVRYEIDLGAIAEFVVGDDLSGVLIDGRNTEL